MKRIHAAFALTLMLGACSPQTTIDTSSNTSAESSAMVPTPSMGKRMPMEWTSTQTGTDENGAPEMNISLKVIGTGEELYRTTCQGTTSTEIQDAEGSVASMQCYWAGGGDQYGVFIGEAEQVFVRHRTVDEEAGFGTWTDVTAQ